MLLPTSHETLAPTTAASPKPWNIRAVGDEANHLAHEWRDAVHVGNYAPRILLARGPANASGLCYPPHARLICYFGVSGGPFHFVSSRCFKWAVGDPNLTSASAKSQFVSRKPCTRLHARERVLEVDHEKLPQRVVGSEGLAALPLMLHAVERTVLGLRALAEVVCGPLMATTSPTESPPSALGKGARGLTPSAPSRERGCSAMCAVLPLCAAVSKGCVRGVSAARNYSRQKLYPARTKKTFLNC